MKNNLKIEIFVSLILIILTVLLLNPFHFWMPNMLHMLMLGITLVTFTLFAVFILREKAEDEREVVHRMLSGRVAFFIGSTILTIAIVVESFQDNIDIWLVVVLVAMVFSKLVTRLYSDKCL